LVAILGLVLGPIGYLYVGGVSPKSLIPAE
jgi:hypothetical protein